MRAERGALRVPSAAECLARVTIVRWALKLAGYSGPRQRIERRIARATVVGDGDPRAVAAIEYAVAMGAALFPGRAQCLERSLVLYDYLRCRGIVAHMRLWGSSGTRSWRMRGWSIAGSRSTTCRSTCGSSRRSTPRCVG